MKFKLSPFNVGVGVNDVFDRLFNKPKPSKAVAQLHDLAEDAANTANQLETYIDDVNASIMELERLVDEAAYERDQLRRVAAGLEALASGGDVSKETI